MKNKIFRIILFLIISFSCIIYLMTSISKHKIIDLNSIPIFLAYDLDSVKIDNQHLTAKHIIIIYFNSDCELCQYEAEELFKNKLKLVETQILMMSSEQLNIIKKFVTKYQLNTIANLSVVQIPAEYVYKDFGFLDFPEILIYNSKRRLVKHFQGETKAEAILKYLQ